MNLDELDHYKKLYRNPTVNGFRGGYDALRGKPREVPIDLVGAPSYKIDCYLSHWDIVMSMTPTERRYVKGT